MTMRTRGAKAKAFATGLLAMLAGVACVLGVTPTTPLSSALLDDAAVSTPARPLAVVEAAPIPASASTSTAAPAPAPRDVGGGSFAMRVGRLITVDPKLPPVIDNGIIVVRDGLIVAIGADVRIPSDLRVIDLRDATVMPGMVAANAPSSPSSAPESMRAAYRASDAFDRYADSRDVLAKGVTTMHLNPGWNRLVSGQGGVVRLGGDIESRVLRETSDLTINLGDGALNPNTVLKQLVPPSSDNAIEPAQPQRPTARLGQYLALKEAIEAAMNPGNRGFDVHSAALAEAWRSNLPVRVQTQRAADIAGAITFLSQQKKAGYIVGGAEAAIHADALAKAGVPLVYAISAAFDSPGANLGNNPNVTDADIGDLSRLTGLKLALAAGPGQPVTDLRLAAVMARRAGLPTQRIIEAITRVPAELLGVSDKVGSLEVGKRADLVVLSGDPLSTSGQVERVYVDGELAYSRASDRRYGADASDASADADAAPPMVVRAGTIWMGPNDWLERGEILIENGKITAVGKKVAVPRGARVIDAGPDAFVTPGFIDAYGHLGMQGDQSALAPEFTLAKLVGIPDLAELRVARAGVTTVMTAPYRSAAQGSQMAAIKTAGSSRDRRVVSPTAGLVFDLGDADPVTVGDRFKARIEAGKKYLETWKKHEAEVAEWAKKKADGTLEAAKPKVVEEAPTAPKQDDPITGTWRARLFGGPIQPADEREGTIVFKLTGNQFEGRLIEPAVPVEFKIVGTLDGKKMSGKLEIESRGLGYPTFEGVIDREDHAAGTISFQGFVINFDMRRTDKSEVEFKIESSKKRKTTGKDGRPLPPKVDDSLEPVKLALEKKIPLVVQCTSPAQIDAVLDVLVDQYDVPVILLDAGGAMVHAARLAEKNVAVVPAPTVLRRDELRRRHDLDELSRKGVRVGMQSNAEDGARTLPTVALYAVEQGWSPEGALAALTIDAAKMYKLESRLGMIAPGKEGDLVIFSGYPFDAGSSVSRVIISGEEVSR